jgi:hypothetical protein
MNFTYHQSTGELYYGNNLIGIGYSGMPPRGKNNPAAQDQHNVGPIPQGWYSIGPPHDTASHGPFVMALTPDANNKMFGRAGFLMHSDSISHPGHASEGCIVISTEVRRNVWDSGDRRLNVVP